VCIPRVPGVGNPDQLVDAAVDGAGLLAWAGALGCSGAPISQNPYTGPRSVCMYRKLHRHGHFQRHMKANPQLNRSDVVLERLSSAMCTSRHASERPRFTFVGAAAGGSSTGESWVDWLDMHTSAGVQIMGGGFLGDVGQDAQKHDTSPAGHAIKEYTVPMVDVAAWMGAAFSKRDHVVLKMDIEGAEHLVAPNLIQQGAMALVDVFVFECHVINTTTHKPEGKEHPKCAKLIADLKAAAPQAQYLDEDASFGFDQYNVPLSKPEKQDLMRVCNVLRPGAKPVASPAYELNSNEAIYPFDLTRRVPRPVQIYSSGCCSPRYMQQERQRDGLIPLRCCCFPAAKPFGQCPPGVERGAPAEALAAGGNFER